MMKKSSQFGKGLSGFFFGLILATVIIAGILFYLNQNNQNAFKNPTVSKPAEETEILQPQGKPVEENVQPEAKEEPVQAASEATKANEPADSREPAAPSAEPEKAEPNGSKEESSQDGQKQTDKVAREEAKDEEVVKNKHENAVKEAKKEPRKPSAKEKEQTNKTNAAKAVKENGKKAEKETAKTDKQKAQPKPTPEQILNSGSIEKARTAAAKEAAKVQTAKQNSSHYLQMGAYANKHSAEEQRAKLAILGVASKVVEYQAGSKTLYRVQSGNMSADAVKKLQADLKKHDVGSLIRSIENQ